MSINKLYPILAALPGFLIYLPSLSYFFAQDDYIHLYSSQAKSFLDVLNFFNPFYQFSDIFFYRPLTTQFYFFINHSLFGLNPVLFHLEALMLHLANSLLFYLLVLKIWQRRLIALIATFIFSISAVHFLSFFYISAIQQLGKTFFIFLGIYYFLRFQESKKRLLYFLTILSFIGALLSKETSIIFPLLLIPIELIRQKDINILKVIQKNLKNLLPLFGISLLYLIIRFIGFQTIFNQGGYNFDFSFINILQNLKWYLLWIFGLPEVISIYPSVGLNGISQFIADFQYGLLIILTFILTSIGLIFTIPNIKNLNLNTYIAVGLFLLFTLSPTLILDEHRYPHYLDLSLLLIFPLIISLFLRSKIFKVIGALTLISFSLLQFLSINLSESSHWSTHRSNVSKYYYQQLKSSHPSLPNQTTVIFTGNNAQINELSYSLAKDYALKVWYPEKVKQVIFKELVDDSLSPEGSITIPITKY